MRQKGLKPIRRDEHEAGRDRVTGMVEFQLSAASHDFPAVVAAYAGNAIEQLLLPLTLKRRNP